MRPRMRAFVVAADLHTDGIQGRRDIQMSASADKGPRSPLPAWRHGSRRLRRASPGLPWSSRCEHGISLPGYRQRRGRHRRALEGTPDRWLRYARVGHVGYGSLPGYPQRLTSGCSSPLPGNSARQGRRSSGAPCCAHFNFREPRRRAAGLRPRAHTSTGSGTNSRPIHERSKSDCVSTTPSSTRSWMRCIRRSSSIAAFNQDAADNEALAANGKLAMPVLAFEAIRQSQRATSGSGCVQRDRRRCPRCRPLGHGKQPARRRRRLCVSNRQRSNTDVRPSGAHCAATPTFRSR